jgi:hypothetical protein
MLTAAMDDFYKMATAVVLVILAAAFVLMLLGALVLGAGP